MVISDFAIKRPIITVVSMLALVVFGLFALFRLQTDEFPDIDAPIVFVGIPYPGASPDQVERDVIDPIEEGISSISGLKKLESWSQRIPMDASPATAHMFIIKPFSGSAFMKLTQEPGRFVENGIPTGYWFSS